MSTLFDDEPAVKHDGASPVLEFTVYGRPQQRGSKQAMVRYGRDGKPITKNGRVLTFAKDDNPKSGDWMNQVKATATHAYGVGRPLIDRPVAIVCKFFFNRPKGHYGARGLKPSAPRFHAQSPDLDKLVRCLCDGLTGTCIIDDKLIFRSTCERYWTDSQERAEVSIYCPVK